VTLAQTQLFTTTHEVIVDVCRRDFKGLIHHIIASLRLERALLAVANLQSIDLSDIHVYIDEVEMGGIGFGRGATTHIIGRATLLLAWCRKLVPLPRRHNECLRVLAYIDPRRRLCFGWLKIFFLLFGESHKDVLAFDYLNLRLLVFRGCQVGEGCRHMGLLALI